MKAGEHFEKYFYLDNQSYMVNTEGLTTEQVAEIDALKAQVEDANNARAEFEEKNRELGDKIYKLKKESKTDNQTAGLSLEEIKQSLKQDELFSKHAHLEQAHKDEIQELTSKGIDFDIALMQIEKRDPTIAERAKAQTTNFTD
tara:strand:- start:549 stop:980 length:432 start_codon:yes stop_codon:yes gene_type:complete